VHTGHPYASKNVTFEIMQSLNNHGVKENRKRPKINIYKKVSQVGCSNSATIIQGAVV